MKIHLKNVGTIKALDFELRRGLTLLCGPNSTGKTYAAYAVYSVLRNLVQIQQEWIKPEQVNQLKASGSLRMEITSLVTNPDRFSDQLSEYLSRDFAVPHDFFASGCISVSDLPSNPALEDIIFRSTVARIQLKEGSLFLEIELLRSLDQPEPDSGGLVDALNRAISFVYGKTNIPRAIVLTAERAGIQLFASEILAGRTNLVNDLLGASIHNQESTDVLRSRARPYSLPIIEGLQVAAGLKNLIRETGDFAKLAGVLEQRILGGQVHVGEFGEVSYAPSGGQAALRIEMSASIIKSLASLVFYLRHQSRKGDVLIIDEPELNLHPENQRKLGRFLCELANAGLDIIISTHSDYIIREVNNLILLNKPALAGVKARNGYTDAELIAPEHVSVVLFNLEGMPEQLEVGPEGFAVASIDDEIARMNRIASEIMLESEE